MPIILPVRAEFFPDLKLQIPCSLEWGILLQVTEFSKTI